jgi:CRP-like cAMP-binding protein
MKKELVFRWMSHDPITVTPDTGLLDADKIMHRYNIRRLPVVKDNGKLVGIVTRGDIREASPSDATSSCEMEFPEGEIIYRKGDMGQALYLIEEGQVAVEMDVPNLGQVTVNTFGLGQIFGWSSLFPSERKVGWTRATKPTQALAINVQQTESSLTV